MSPKHEDTVFTFAEKCPWMSTFLIKIAFLACCWLWFWVIFKTKKIFRESFDQFLIQQVTFVHNKSLKVAHMKKTFCWLVSFNVLLGNFYWKNVFKLKIYLPPTFSIVFRCFSMKLKTFAYNHYGWAQGKNFKTWWCSNNNGDVLCAFWSRAHD